MVLLAVAAVLVVAMLVVAVVLLVRLVRTRRALRRAGLPTGRAWVFWGAIGYLVLPADLMPDPVLLDDIGVLFLALRSLRSGAEPPSGGGGEVLRTREERSGAAPGGAADAPW
ncbi:YkvA family protein [Streptomyces sp. NPDC017941]|uniref:YkvA family protein n=1 Tax=Streptomyces sp. NPDC017941 TaxID=3365018 RepID=UPI0037AD4F99